MRFETWFELHGDLIGVDAVVVRPSGRADIQLVLDTGAVHTTLVPTVAQAIGYDYSIEIRPPEQRGEGPALDELILEPDDEVPWPRGPGATFTANSPRRLNSHATLGHS